MLAILMLAIAVVVGAYQGSLDTRPVTVIVTATVVLGISNLLACWPDFVVDQPLSWPRTYVSGLLFTGCVSLVVHVLPFCLAWYFVKRLRNIRLDNAA